MSIHSRTNPFFCTIKERYLLTKPGSSKETFHIALDISEGILPFHVGDSIAVFPDNDAELVDAIIRELGFAPDVRVTDRSENSFELREYLLKKANISKCTTSLLRILKDTGEHAELLSQLLTPEGKPQAMEFLHKHQLFDILAKFPNSEISPQQLCCTLLPLMPRFYSVASSPNQYPREIHLTVASLTYATAGGARKGAGSHFLGHFAIPFETRIPIYVQPSNGFTLPEDPNAAVIMVGPGTGIAPFRAFLQDRMALRHQGRNWLFFGERNRATDFYYDEYLLTLEKTGHLTLDLAFSRDETEKVYVQHRLWEKRAEIWAWLQKGAYLFVCGDAEKMAKDVDVTLQRIAQDAGFTEEASRQWLKDLRKSRHYRQDVY